MFLTLLLLATLAQDPPVAPANNLTLSGRVVGADGRPVDGAEVLLSGIGGMDGKRPVLARGRSDTEGRFRVSVPPEPDPKRANLSLALWAYRPGMAAGGVGVSRQKPPAEGTVVVKLGAAEHVDVRVHGPGGEPVAGATVVPRMLRIEGGLPPTSSYPPPDELAARMTARTDAEGKGRMADVVPQEVQAVQVDSAQHGLQWGAFSADATGVMTVKLATAGRVSGRVLADDPATARGLTVIAFTRPAAPGPGAAMGEVRVTTDAEGRFEVPAIATGRLALNVLVPEGSGLSPRLPSDRKVEPGRGTEVEIRLKGPGKLRTVAGRVVDRRGGPVAGAAVSQSGDAPSRTRAEADAQGRFTLPGVAAGRTFLFVRAAGYRFAGRAVGPEDGEVALTVTHEGEAPAETLAAQSPALPRDEELALARRVLDPYAERVLKNGDESEKIQLIEALARAEPARVLELIEKNPFSQSFLNDMLRMRAAAGLRADAPDEALAVVESMKEPGFRAMALIAEVDALPAAEKAKKLELLARAVVDARGAKNPSFKLSSLGQVAERWLDLGETGRGEALLREGEKIAAELPNAAFAGYVRGAFAEELAQVDLKAALTLTRDLSDPREFDRHHGNIAHELAGRDPAEAERVLAMVRDPSQRDQYTVRVVYRMARVDHGRARRLAEAINDVSLRGYALGMMALGLAESDRKAEAAALLDQAFAALEQAAEAGKGKSASLYSPAPVAAVLLPVAERIEQRRVPESFWRALSLRAPRSAGESMHDPSVHADLQLTLMLARYDRAVARSLIEPFVGPDAPVWVRVSSRGLPFVASAMVEPRWGVELVEALPDGPDLESSRPRNAARLAVAQALARRGEGRWRYLSYQHLHLWVPDIEDHAPDL